MADDSFRGTKKQAVNPHQNLIYKKIIIIFHCSAAAKGLFYF